MDNTENLIKEVASGGGEKENKKEDYNQLVVFELDREEYAVGITEIQEIINIPDITPIPNSPKFISGILNLRGRIIVVFDLEKRFSLVREHGESQDGNIVIIEVDGNYFGIVVDKVNEIVRVPVSVIQSTPSLVTSKINSDYLKGVVVLENENQKEVVNKKNNSSRLIILLNLHKLLQEKDILSLGEKVKKVTNN